MIDSCIVNFLHCKSLETLIVLQFNQCALRFLNITEVGLVKEVASASGKTTTLATTYDRLKNRYSKESKRRSGHGAACRFGSSLLSRTRSQCFYSKIDSRAFRPTSNSFSCITLKFVVEIHNA